MRPGPVGQGSSGSRVLRGPWPVVGWGVPRVPRYSRPSPPPAVSVVYDGRTVHGTGPLDVLATLRARAFGYPGQPSATLAEFGQWLATAHGAPPGAVTAEDDATAAEQCLAALLATGAATRAPVARVVPLRR